LSPQMNEIDPRQIKDNVFKLIADDWALVTAGKLENYNTMTISWGSFGELWHKKVCFCFVRPTRHTYNFMEEAERFTLSFFETEHRPVLKLCGTKSGRDIDKMALPELTANATETGAVYFDQARLVIECRKLYTHDLDPSRFLEPAIEKEYPEKDYHRMYIGEITRCLSK